MREGKKNGGRDVGQRGGVGGGGGVRRVGGEEGGGRDGAVRHAPAAAVSKMAARAATRRGSARARDAPCRRGRGGRRTPRGDRRGEERGGERRSVVARGERRGGAASFKGGVVCVEASRRRGDACGGVGHHTRATREARRPRRRGLRARGPRSACGGRTCVIGHPGGTCPLSPRAQRVRGKGVVHPAVGGADGFQRRAVAEGRGRRRSKRCTPLAARARAAEGAPRG